MANFIKELFCAMIGGFLGSLIRTLITFHSFTHNFPLYNWQTIGLNIVGSGLAGFFITLLRNKINNLVSAILYIGFLGSLTSFSGLIFFVNHYLIQKQITLSLITLCVTVIGGLAAFYLGHLSARLFSNNNTN